MPAGKPLSDDPMVFGGLSATEIQAALNNGWKKSVVQNDHDNIDTVFKDPSNPAGFSIAPASVPAGTEYLWHPDGRGVFASSCGNPTCWRWLTGDIAAGALPQEIDW